LRISEFRIEHICSVPSSSNYSRVQRAGLRFEYLGLGGICEVGLVERDQPARVGHLRGAAAERLERRGGGYLRGRGPSSGAGEFQSEYCPVWKAGSEAGAGAVAAGRTYPGVADLEDEVDEGEAGADGALGGSHVPAVPGAGEAAHGRAQAAREDLRRR
jgi:hypothetical protein